jgi:hypothetical protein
VADGCMPDKSLSVFAGKLAGKRHGKLFPKFVRRGGLIAVNDIGKSKNGIVALWRCWEVPKVPNSCREGEVCAKWIVLSGSRATIRSAKSAAIFGDAFPNA